MSDQTFAEFETQARARGFDEVLERNWAPHAVVDNHRHDFAVSALMVRGELWLTCGTESRHLRSGDTFELARNVEHSERYGPEGAAYWVARRNG